MADLNEFRWKSPAKGPANRYSLRCKQWRHGEQELAIGVVFVAGHRCETDNKNVLRGASKAVVSAANLSDAVPANTPPDFEVVVADTLAIALTLVEEMRGSSGRPLASLLK
ncbi:hypothetical protein QMO14_02375 [Variovorax sp. CAN2819]|uniref:hypothetical protein n=1 Tax=Variovorax sp. CAN15 TaxID=3046727 RepID=UPI002649A326|nr:hypothetical protein [Variovorax sp. CAN15]MDN6882440.1 hypothetical protein [Variovorax sp. CAN15]